MVTNTNMMNAKLTENSRFDILKEPTHNNRSSNRSSNRPNTNNRTFSNNLELFPELASRGVKTDETNMNFANAAQPIITKKKEEVKKGWVKITRTNKKIKYTYNTSDKSEETPKELQIENETNGFDHKQQNKLQEIVMRWEGYRNHQNEMYEEASPYWHEKSMLDPLSDSNFSSSDESESEQSITEDDDHDDAYNEF